MHTRICIYIRICIHIRIAIDIYTSIRILCRCNVSNCVRYCVRHTSISLNTYSGLQYLFIIKKNALLYYIYIERGRSEMNWQNIIACKVTIAHGTAPHPSIQPILHALVTKGMTASGNSPVLPILLTNRAHCN